MRPPSHAQDDTPRADAAHEPIPRRREWRSYIEELIEEAQRRGEFDALPGAGQPLHLDENVYAGARALGYHLLKSNHLAPPEIERGKEIDAELARAEALLTTLRHQRDALRMRTVRPFASERRAYNLLRAKTRARYTEALRLTNSKILSLNIISPPALHRLPVDVDAHGRAFDVAFPLVED